VIGVDPNPAMFPFLERRAAKEGCPVRPVLGRAEALPVDTGSVDVVVGTLTMCSVDDVLGSLREIQRVLRPGGKYLFSESPPRQEPLPLPPPPSPVGKALMPWPAVPAVEHVRARTTGLAFAQAVLEPLQVAAADGCHLTRETGKTIQAAGFKSVELREMTLPVFPLISPHVVGVAMR